MYASVGLLYHDDYVGVVFVLLGFALRLILFFRNHGQMYNVLVNDCDVSLRDSYDASIYCHVISLLHAHGVLRG